MRRDLRSSGDRDVPDKAVTRFAESTPTRRADFAAFTGAIADGQISAHEDAGGARAPRRPGAQQCPGQTDAHRQANNLNRL
jgi:hypothetical protein